MRLDDLHKVGDDEDINATVLRVTGQTMTMNGDGHFAHDNLDTANYILTGTLPDGRTVTVYVAPNGSALIGVI